MFWAGEPEPDGSGSAEFNAERVGYECSGGFQAAFLHFWKFGGQRQPCVSERGYGDTERRNDCASDEQ